MKRMSPALSTAMACALVVMGSAPGLAHADSRAAGRTTAARASTAAGALAISADGHSFYGDWHADISISNTAWQPGATVDADVAYRFAATYIAALTAANVKADRLCVLMTAERTFDSTGWMRLPSDERMSTILTPTGLPIEGGIQGAVTNRYGYQFKSPVDQFSFVLASAAVTSDVSGFLLVRHNLHQVLPADLPPGLYRLRFDFGVMVGTRAYNVNGLSFTSRPFSDQAGTLSYIYSPIIEASGTDASGRFVDASQIHPRFPWLLLAAYNSNGYRGVVADEDQSRFAFCDHSLISDDVILPMWSDWNSRLTYSLEPQFPADTIDADANIAWNWQSGELSAQVTAPDGTVTDLGTARILAKYNTGPTTNSTAFTAWKPTVYGRYTAVVTGWIQDQQGRRYDGGGTYSFWIAKRLTLATATFQGMSYQMGTTYGRDIQFNPPVPANVEVTATLFINSDPANTHSITYSGRASNAGIFGAAQGLRAFPLSYPGEYHAKVLATYTDPEGHLWVSTMRHAGIVYPDASTVTARGKKLLINSQYVDRGQTGLEGYIETNGTQHLQHLTFPYQSGDVLLVAAEGQGANKIEPVLTYQMQGDTSAWDTKLNSVGTTNLRIKTSNGYSPHLYPEYITDLEYFYGAAPRPGFMGRFIVGESNLRTPYWSVSPNSFGSQIAASSNGDAPGDIYRLIGGVVLRRAGQTPLYAGYLSSAFLLPKGSNNNRVVEAGSEDLNGPFGTQARFFLVGLRPGTSYEVGSSFRAAVQIDPVLPVNIHFVLNYPDGRQAAVDGTGDRFGSFASPGTYPLDVEGVYTYQLTANWGGYEGRMPGLPDSGGMFFVYSRTRPLSASGLHVDGASQRTIPASGATTITGYSTAETVYFTLVMPGAVVAQGQLPVIAGKFTLVFDPATVHTLVPLYDITNISTGKAQLGRVLHLTFFSHETVAAGSFWDVTRVVLRGTTLVAPREPLPAETTYPVSVSKTGDGTISLRTASGGVECQNCTQSYSANSVVTLTANAASGALFIGWTGACSGMGPCTVTVNAAKTVAAQFISTGIIRRYFAEGAVGSFFNCRFSLFNPGTTTAHVTMRFRRDAGASASYQVEVAPMARRTIDTATVPGLAPSTGFSTIVESDTLVVADRTMSWGKNSAGAHAEGAVEAPAMTWYLAEGSTTGGLQLYYLVFNPNTRPAPVRVVFSRKAGQAAVTKTYTVAAQARLTINANREDSRLAAADVSATITALDPAAPVVVERSLFAAAQEQTFGAGSVAAGVTTPATEWFLADGATGPTFDEYLLIANPSTSTAEVDVTYATNAGSTVVRHYSVQPNSRTTVWVNEEPGLDTASIWTRVRSTNSVGVVVERAMWWPAHGPANWYESHASAGSTSGGTLWAVADGEQGGTRLTQTYLHVANTTTHAGRVRVTLVFDDATTVTKEIDLPANGRASVWTGGTSESAASPFGNAANGKKFSALIESVGVGDVAPEIVVERSMYWDAGSRHWAAGTNLVGTRLR